MNCVALDLAGILDSIESLDWLDEQSFHAWEFEVVQRYRRNEEEQEAIAAVINRRSLRPCTTRARARIDEVLAMLRTTHDPLL